MTGKKKKLAKRTALDATTINVRPGVMLAFVRALVRNTWSGDVLTLTLLQTKTDADATDEEIASLKAAILQERNSHPQSPKGFMPEFE